MADNALPRLMNVDEVAPLLRVSAERVRQLVKAGRLAAVRFGDGPRPRLRFRRSDVSRFLGGEVPAG